MKLYHFTCDHMMPGVCVQGIDRGRLLRDFWNGSPVLVAGYQSLTSDPHPEAQEWVNPESLICNRLAWRFAIEIPAEAEPNVLSWSQAKRAVRMSRRAARALEMVGGRDAWMVYRGSIPAAWLSPPERP